MSTRRLLVLLMTAGFAAGMGLRLQVGSGRPDTRPIAPRIAPSHSSDASVDPSLLEQSSDAGLDEAPQAPRPPESVESVLAASGFERSDRLGRFLERASVVDLERLFEGLDLGHRRGSDEMALTLFLRWMELDPAGGLNYASRKDRRATAWRAWGQVDADTALAAARQRESRSLGTWVLEGIADADPAKARALVEAHPELASEEAYLSTAAGLMRTDPEAGATQWAAIGDLEDSEEIRAWVRRAPDDALAWARNLPDQQQRTEAMKHVLSRWAQDDPEAAGSAIMALPEGRLKRGLFADHAGILAAAGDPAAAREWIERAPSAQLRSESLIEMAGRQAESDTAGAFATLREVDWSASGADRSPHLVLSPDGTEPQGWNSWTATADLLASKAPAESMAFLAELPESAPVRTLAHDAFRTWLDLDAWAASDWLAGQPEGEIKANSTKLLVHHLIDDFDIESATHWAITLPSTADGAPAIDTVLRQWLELRGPGAPAAARAAIESLPVSPEERQRLINLLPALP